MHVHPLAGAAPAARDVVLIRCGGAFGFRLPGARGAPGEVALGRVVAAGRGPAVCSLERGPLRRLPARWLGAAVDALEVLARIRAEFQEAFAAGLAVAGFDPRGAYLLAPESTLGI